jgi:hypothetical protein
MVRMPVRAAPVLAAAAKVTDPLPLPLVPDVMVSHNALLAAAQGHPAPAVTAIGAPAPPATSIC